MAPTELPSHTNISKYFVVDEVQFPSTSKDASPHKFAQLPKDLSLQKSNFEELIEKFSKMNKNLGICSEEKSFSDESKKAFRVLNNAEIYRQMLLENNFRVTFKWVFLKFLLENILSFFCKNKKPS